MATSAKGGGSKEGSERKWEKSYKFVRQRGREGKGEGERDLAPLRGFENKLHMEVHIRQNCRNSVEKRHGNVFAGRKIIILVSSMLFSWRPASFLPSFVSCFFSPSLSPSSPLPLLRRQVARVLRDRLLGSEPERK